MRLRIRIRFKLRALPRMILQNLRLERKEDGKRKRKEKRGGGDPKKFKTMALLRVKRVRRAEEQDEETLSSR